MEDSNKQNTCEKEERKEEANNSGAGNVDMMVSSGSLNSGSGEKRKVAKLVDSESYTSEAGGKVANAISKLDISKSTTAERFDNRFTRMKLKRDVLMHTNEGFVAWFNLNSHLMLKECWEEHPNMNEKGDVGEKD